MSKAIPLAEDAGVKIAIEVVWNDFITKPEQLVKYVDQFKTPTVGAYFDISNMIKYGVPPADWIRKLGKRMLKFDFKGYHGKKRLGRHRRGRRGLAGGAQGAGRGRLQRLGHGRGGRRRRRRAARHLARMDKVLNA